MSLITDNPPSGPRHRKSRQKSPGRLAVRWFVTFRWHLLLLFLSDLGRAMIRYKYDAFTTDNAYSARPVGGNLVTRAIDSIVRRRDTHVALRQRLDIVTSELVEAALSKRGDGVVRLVSGPVGLGRDLRQAWSRLEKLDTRPESWLEVFGIDIDASGTVLEEASRLASEMSVPLQTYRRDLLRDTALAKLVGGPVDVFNVVGLTTWLDEQSLQSLLVSVRLSLSPHGVMIIDHWRGHDGSKHVGDLQMPARYVTDDEFEAALVSAGFAIQQKRVTGNEVAVIYRVRSAPHTPRTSWPG